MDVDRLVDFVVTGSDGGADRDQQVLRARSESIGKHTDDFTRDAASRSFPPRVNCGNGVVARIGQEHRHTIGGMNGEGQVFLRGRHAIGPLDDSTGVCGGHTLDGGPVHLGGLDKARRIDPKRIEDGSPVSGHVFRVVIHPSTKIERVVWRRADAKVPGREGVRNAGLPEVLGKQQNGDGQTTFSRIQAEK